MQVWGEHIRIRGIVQGVGFRPTVARIARSLGLRGWVKNDTDGVLIMLACPTEACTEFIEALLDALPPLARVHAVERATVQVQDADDFTIVRSDGGEANTSVSPDAATCSSCASDIFDPQNHRHRYAFTTCTHCGPRFSIVTGIPWDRPQTTMAHFPMCRICACEYHDETDLRYHAQPIACPDCGPSVRLEPGTERPNPGASDAIEQAIRLLQDGAILAVKGLGGFQLCCDATRTSAVTTLRQRKHRPHKPLACMVRDLAALRRYATCSADEEALVTGPIGPIALLRPLPGTDLAPEVAPDQALVGFMLPTTPLHHLLLEQFDGPLVCTSGNLTEEPQCTDDADAQERLAGIADALLLHDRPVSNRIDDSVVRTIDGQVRVLRRARGYAPAPLPLPPGFERPDTQVLATGGDLKAVFALTKGRVVVPSQHLGNLHDVRTLDSWHQAMGRISAIFDHQPTHIAVDAHPRYVSSGHGRSIAAAHDLPCLEVQHHHAHIAAVMAEHARPRDAEPVIGIALDGIGHGERGEAWGGEVFVVDYLRAERVGHLDPVALLGGDRAAVEPWRNLYAHLRAVMSWEDLHQHFGHLPALQHLDAKPRALLDQMRQTGTQAPLASSAGRLFDAVAAALGIHAERITFEGQAAMALEGLVTLGALEQAREEARRGEGYPLPWRTHPTTGLQSPDLSSMWRALLGDLTEGTSPDLVSARFHVALATAFATLVARIRAERPSLHTVALSGGVFANRVLTEALTGQLRDAGCEVLLHRTLPPGDGCLAVGQAMIALATVPR